MINWSVELLELMSLQQEKERQSKGLSPSGAIENKASAERISKVETMLQIKLDQVHKDFLQHSDGWVRFSADIDLFSVQDFQGSNKFKSAEEGIKLLSHSALGKYTSRRNDFLPIGMSSTSSDLLLMMKDKTGRLQPEVIWFANELIEEFDTFEQMFVSFKEYTRKAIYYWREKD